MNADNGLAPLEDAATVVLLRDGASGPEVLMLERPSKGGSFAGAWVFPGGKVDPEDKPTGMAQGASKGTADAAELAAARTAGAREVAEETGQQLAADALVPLSNWLPMRALKRRFRTWFFLAEAASSGVVLNPGEHGAYAWLTPARALARHAAGTMLLMPPTWVTLHHLSGAASVADALAAARGAKPADYRTYVLSDDGGADELVVWAGDEDYPPGGELAPAGGRHRLYAGTLPWRYEHSRPAAS